MRELFFAFIPDRFMSFSLVQDTGMPENGFPSCSAVDKDISTIILCALRKRSTTPSSWILLQTATAEDEDMEPIPRCDYGQLACRLHSIWRSRCAVSDRKRNLSTTRTLLKLTAAQFHERFVTELKWVDEPTVRLQISISSVLR